MVSHLKKLLVELCIVFYRDLNHGYYMNFPCQLVSIRFSIVHHKERARCLIHVFHVFHLVCSTSLGTQHLWMELRDWITQTLWIFLCTMCFSTKWNFETVGKSRKPLTRSFKIFIWIKFFNKLLSSTIKPPIVFPSCCFFYNACCINKNLEVQPLPFYLLPRFWFSRLSSCLSHTVMRLLSTLNFFEAEETFLPLSKVSCVTDDLNSRVYDFLSVIFILNKRHTTPRKHSKKNIRNEKI